MGKPQSNFQYRTIFGVPLIAGNLQIKVKTMPKIKKFKNYGGHSWFGTYLSLNDFKKLKELYKKYLKCFNK